MCGNREFTTVEQGISEAEQGTAVSDGSSLIKGKRARGQESMPVCRPALCAFLDDRRAECDTNMVEGASGRSRGRKNHLFAGSDGRADCWAVVASQITATKLNNREPYAYLKDVLEGMPQGHSASRLDDFLSWNWKPSVL